VLKQLQHFLSYLQQFERVFIRNQIDTTLAEHRYEISVRQKQLEKDEKLITVTKKYTNFIEQKEGCALGVLYCFYELPFYKNGFTSIL